MGILCLFSHKWDGCTCIRCGKVRDNQHSWNFNDTHTHYQCSKCHKDASQTELAYLIQTKKLDAAYKLALFSSSLGYAHLESFFVDRLFQKVPPADMLDDVLAKKIVTSLLQEGQPTDMSDITFTKILIHVLDNAEETDHKVKAAAMLIEIFKKSQNNEIVSSIRQKQGTLLRPEIPSHYANEHEDKHTDGHTDVTSGEANEMYCIFEDHADYYDTAPHKDFYTDNIVPSSPAEFFCVE